MGAELDIDLTNDIGNRTLGETYQEIQRDKRVPFVVWLLENPQSLIALPGKISLPNHDCLHLLLNRGFTPEDEAFILGFTMGNDLETNWLHIQLFKLAARLLYPYKYHLNLKQLKRFDVGFLYGRKVAQLYPGLNRFDFLKYANYRINELRELTGIRIQDLQQLWVTECLLAAA